MWRRRQRKGREGRGEGGGESGEDAGEEGGGDDGLEDGCDAGGDTGGEGGGDDAAHTGEVERVEGLQRRRESVNVSQLVRPTTKHSGVLCVPYEYTVVSSSLRVQSCSLSFRCAHAPRSRVVALCVRRRRSTLQRVALLGPFPSKLGGGPLRAAPASPRRRAALAHQQSRG